MDDHLKIVAENLRESLGRADRYVKISTAAAIFFLLLTRSWKTLEHVTISGFPVMDRVIAAELVGTVFWVSAAMAGYSVERARLLLRWFRRSPQVLAAALTYPAFATERWPGIRAAPAVLPLSLMLIGLYNVGWLTSRTFWTGRLLVTVLLAVPSLVLWFELSNFGRLARDVTEAVVSEPATDSSTLAISSPKSTSAQPNSDKQGA